MLQQLRKRTFLLVAAGIITFSAVFSGVQIPAAKAATSCVTSPTISARTATAISPSGLSETLSPNIGQIGALPPEAGKPDWDGADRANDVKVLPGNLAVIVGKFTKYQWKGADYNRNNFVVINTATGAPQSIAPNINGELLTVELACNGNAVYVGGSFNRVNGVVRNNAAKISLTDGSLMEWNPNANGSVQDIAQIKNKLVLGGKFTQIGSATRNGIASVTTKTGVATNWVLTRLAGGAETKGNVAAFNVIPSPDHSLLVITGNFYKVNGANHKRMAVLKYASKHPQLQKWNTPLTEKGCNPKKDHEELGVAFAPNSKAFYTATTGGNVPGTHCDALAKWPVGAKKLTSSNVKPLWINFSNHDTLSGVVATGKSVWVAGHNEFCAVKPGRPIETVDRPGICEVNAKTGKVTAWNGTTSRQRSLHVRMALTPQGLIYVGDANKLNGIKDKHNDLGLWQWAN